MTQEQRKTKAIELLHKFDIYEPYIQNFLASYKTYYAAHN